MVNALNYLGGRYVKATQLPTERHVVAVITSVVPEIMEQSGEEKLVVGLRSTTNKRPWPKPWVPNVTARKALTAAFGGETDDWIGKTVELWAAPTQFGAETVLGIKVLALNGAGAAKPALEASPIPPAAAPPASAQRAAINDDVPLAQREPGAGDLDDEIPWAPCTQ